MQHRIIRRLATVAVAASIPLLSLTSPAPAQALTAPASSAAQWLSKQLTNGLVHNDQYAFDDYGLSLDIFFALDALNAMPSSADSIIQAIKKHPTQYTTDPYTPGSHFAGSLGKLASAVQLNGGNASSFGGHDLITEAQAQVVMSGVEKGRAKDTYEADFVEPYGEPESYDYSNAIGQAWVVRALTTAHNSRAADVTSYLLKQQCNNGSFRETLSGTQCTSGSGSVDATAFAIQALDVAQDNGIDGLGDDVANGVTWLSGTQARSGAFSDAGTFNTNSTGLVTAVLADHGQTARAQKAAKWILGHQVTSNNAGNGPLKNEVGAIAYDAAALTAGKNAGITDAIEDQWRRATAQAAIGIDVALPPTPKPPTPRPPSGGGPSGGGSSDGSSSNNGSSGEPFYGGLPVDEPDETVKPDPTPTPEPAATEGADTDTASTAPKAEEAGGSTAGWIVAGVAGALMLVTAGAVGIGRLRGGDAL